MIITLIGKSNTGKTYWSKKLERIGFFRVSAVETIDRIIRTGSTGFYNKENVVIDTTEKLLREKENLLSELYKSTVVLFLEDRDRTLCEIDKIFLKYSHSSINYFLLRSKYFETGDFLNILLTVNCGLISKSNIFEFQNSLGLYI